MAESTSAAIDALAARIENGDLLAATDPAAFLGEVANLIDDLRDRAKKAETQLAELREKVGAALDVCANRERLALLMGPMVHAQVEEMLRSALAAVARGEGE